MLGVCYYPEHWPEERWSEDARMMADLGIRFVRIGEFAWSRLEPARDRFDWTWLDRVLDILNMAGLQVVLCTPTATPPKWLIDQRPDILAWDETGQPRRFGSRRHYCFTSPSWRAETARICLKLARRYGDHPAVVGWQLDNEYGCHDTVLSYAPHCRLAFQRWLERRHGTIERLNEAWGTVFWSGEYTDFAQIGLPYQTVTEAHPAHRLDFQRFSSDQVIDYNRMQAEIIRQHSPERFVSHNAMGLFHDFDHRSLAHDLDVITWDSYPLGFTDQRMGLDDASRASYARSGHPDIAAWHHDLYRGTAENGRFWVMEQQPGPVNWADHNPIPAPGMVRLWTLEALAHGAEVVSYFRWRQAPFGQEQMHAGLLRSDGEPAPVVAEIERVRQDMKKLALDAKTPGQAKIALITDDPCHWIYRIQPQGAGFDLGALNLTFYTACRRLGLDVDVLRPGADLAGYALVLIPSLPLLPKALIKALSAFDGNVIAGPRTGGKTRTMQTPKELPPGDLQTWLPIKVIQVGSLPPGADGGVVWNDKTYPLQIWQEAIQSDLEPSGRFTEGGGAIYQSGNCHYLGFWPDPSFLLDYLEATLGALGVETLRLPEPLRLRRLGDLTFAFNSGPEPIEAPAPNGADYLLGGAEIAPRDLAVWKS
ncbi:MAG: beta-galactosidase [Alphaproteobacteria bacterium]|nr:beta-galactosidase [Alphaproteobacteria bacterium]